ncbi:Bax inhibitor-1/YccA family protein [Jeongeupia naejangsanensis]|uniref:Bax inhibitor-1/YccA family protein n=1 Tax=Jeongeupia naejangsanensis TaxID=613195 RepID=A0ABS2BKW6_9NEIS|nr:Bax inhibitor-1/YccA family protein [Jeongeupia naejangsanensis]MBM3116265.1 Bax inhibitor-1/YccA family protein [Jeongeupia naejangsanensis]
MQLNTARYGGESLAVERNRVLRNTYFLLALSMLPTALGALVGVSMQFAMSPLMGAVVFLGISFGAFFAIEKTKNSGMGVVLLLAYTGFMGLWLSQILQVALRFSNGAQMIGTAAVGTAAIFFTLSAIATVTKKDFSFMGKFLMIGVVMLILASLGNLFFQIPALSLAISAIAVLIFSAFILVDTSRIVNGGETNYVSATLQLYLNIYNLFISLLNILMAFSGNNRN